MKSINRYKKMAKTVIEVDETIAAQLNALSLEYNQSIDELLRVFLSSRFMSSQHDNKWALALAQRMKEADIEWKNDPDASINSRARYKKHLLEKWQRGQVKNSDE